MERPIIEASRFEKSGNRLLVVHILIMETSEMYVTFSTMYDGSGSAMGDWPNGFIDTKSVVKAAEKRYFCDTFGLDESRVSNDEILKMNQMYLEARGDATKRLAVNWMSRGRRRAM